MFKIFLISLYDRELDHLNETFTIGKPVIVTKPGGAASFVRAGTIGIYKGKDKVGYHIVDFGINLRQVFKPNRGKLKKYKLENM